MNSDPAVWLIVPCGNSIVMPMGNVTFACIVVFTVIARASQTPPEDGNAAMHALTC